MRSGAHVRQNHREKNEPVEKTEKNNAEEHLEKRLEWGGMGGEGEGERKQEDVVE